MDNVESRIFETIEIGNKWAVLVGINEYEDTSFRSLNYCVNDINSFYKIILDSEKGKYIEDNVELLIDGGSLLPRRNILLSKLRKICRNAAVDDSILFYFSGHGTVRNDSSYLLCRDSFNNALTETAISINNIRRIMQDSLARIKIIILDACHSGAIKGVKDSGMMLQEFYDTVYPAPEGFIILTSCKLYEYSYEYEEMEKSVFSYYFIEGLNGNADKDKDGLITLTDSHKYTYDNVTKWAFSKNLEQTPTLEAKIAGYVPFIYSEIKEVEEVKLNETVIEKVQFESYYVESESQAKLMAQSFLGELLNYYNFNDIKKTRDTLYEFPNGNIEIKGTRPEPVFIVIDFETMVDSEKSQEILSKILNIECEWDHLRYYITKNIDFNKLFRRCKTNSFKVISFEPGPEKRMIQFESKMWANTKTSFISEKGINYIEIMPLTGMTLDQNFYEVINLNNISEFLKGLF